MYGMYFSFVVFCIAIYCNLLWWRDYYYHFFTYIHVLSSINVFIRFNTMRYNNITHTHIRVGVKYSTCTWYLYLSTYLSVLDVLEYLVYGNVKVLVLVLVLDQKVLGTYK